MFNLCLNNQMQLYNNRSMYFVLLSHNKIKNLLKLAITKVVYRHTTKNLNSRDI